MSRKRSRKRPILLPWERENAWLRELLSGRRWRTVLVLGIGVAAIAFAYDAADRRARVRTTRTAIAETERAVALFVAELGRCPHSTTELVHPPKTGAHYLNETPVDGWDRPLHIRCPSEDEKRLADVLSAGPSGSFLIDDNVL